MNRRNFVLSGVVIVTAIMVVSCPFLIGSGAARNVLYTALGKTGSATVVCEQARLVVVPFPIDPTRNDSGTTYQALGVLIPQSDNYELRSLATEASVVLDQNKPLAVSQDRAYLQVGEQQVRLSDWTLVEPQEREWEPLRKDVDTSASSPSKNGQVDFSIRSSAEGIPFPQGDWRIYTRVPYGPIRVRYYGRGAVQQAGWSPDQQRIYIANDGRILTVSLDQGSVR